MADKAPCSSCTGQTAAMYYEKVLQPVLLKLEDENDRARYRSYYMMKLHGYKLSEEQHTDFERLKALTQK